VPTIVIHGADDPLILPACGQDTAASIPDAEFMLVQGMGHDLPDALYSVVIAAIDRTASCAFRRTQIVNPPPCNALR
jgi:pimeloyl-ACP methyl ester carboxylesterase